LGFFYTDVIPTLNELGGLIRCLESLQNRTAVNAIIVADGGSIDRSPALAAKLGARVVESPKGRGLQISKGDFSVRKTLERQWFHRQFDDGISSFPPLSDRAKILPAQCAKAKLL